MAKTTVALELSAASYNSKKEQNAPELREGILALPHGAISEILGARTSGRTAVAHSILATASRAGEVCAVIDASSSFDPSSALRSGADLGKLLWVQCNHRLDTAIKATDMILHSGGFGVVLLDLCDVAPAAFNSVPLSYWYRFRLALEPTQTTLLILAAHSVAKSCALKQFTLQPSKVNWRGQAPFQTMEGLETQANSRKPVPGPEVELYAFDHTFAHI